MIDTSERRLLSAKEAARYLSISLASFLKLGFARIQVGERSVRYDLKDLDAYIEANRQTRRVAS